jgi:hypothetical protein
MYIALSCEVIALCGAFAAGAPLPITMGRDVIHSVASLSGS